MLETSGNPLRWVSAEVLATPCDGPDCGGQDIDRAVLGQESRCSELECT